MQTLIAYCLCSIELIYVWLRYANSFQLLRCKIDLSYVYLKFLDVCHSPRITF